MAVVYLLYRDIVYFSATAKIGLSSSNTTGTTSTRVQLPVMYGCVCVCVAEVMIIYTLQGMISLALPHILQPITPNAQSKKVTTVPSHTLLSQTLQSAIFRFQPTTPAPVPQAHAANPAYPAYPAAPYLRRHAYAFQTPYRSRTR